MSQGTRGAVRKIASGAAVEYALLLFAVLLVPAGGYWLFGSTEKRAPDKAASGLEAREALEGLEALEGGEAHALVAGDSGDRTPAEGSAPIDVPKQGKHD